MIDNKRVVNILWTGGWDSSYRMVELSRKPVYVQPIYVYGEGRPSEKYENRAMNRILKLITEKKETKAEILPIKYVHFDSIKLDEKISKSYHNILNEIHLGSQYEWLPCLALEYPNLEIGVEKVPVEHMGGANTAIYKYGKMKYVEDYNTYLLDTEKSTSDLSLLFGNLSFPIIDKDLNVMKSNIFKMGYEDVMENVWTCYTPIFGEPCGTCNPCKSKIEKGMKFMFTSNSLKRYRERQQNNKFSYYINGILKKTSSIFDRFLLREYTIKD